MIHSILVRRLQRRDKTQNKHPWFFFNPNTAEQRYRPYSGILPIEILNLQLLLGAAVGTLGSSADLGGDAGCAVATHRGGAGDAARSDRGGAGGTLRCDRSGAGSRLGSQARCARGRLGGQAGCARGRLGSLAGGAGARLRSDRGRLGGLDAGSGGQAGGRGGCGVASVLGQAGGGLGSRNAGGRRVARSRGAGDGGDGAQAGLGIIRSETDLVESEVVVVAKATVGRVGLLSKPVAGAGSGGTVSGGSRGSGVASSSLSGVLAGESNELVTLAALWDLEAVLVGPLLDLAVRPALQKSVTQRSLSGSSRLGGSSVFGSSGIRANLAIAAHAGDELVAVGWLRGWDAALIEPLLEVGVGPRLVEPVTWVGSGLANLVRDGLVVRSSSVQERIAVARRRVRNAVVVEERLQLGLGPSGRGVSVECSKGEEREELTSRRSNRGRWRMRRWHCRRWWSTIPGPG